MGKTSKVSPPVAIADVIRDLVRVRDSLNSRSLQFLEDMQCRLESLGDLFTVSLSQSNWLRSLWYQSCATTVDISELSGLALLKEKKRRLLRKTYREQKKIVKRDKLVASSSLAGICLELQGAIVTAKMRHGRSLPRQFTASPSLPFITDYDQ